MELLQRPSNNALQPTATALVSWAGVGNLIVTVAFRSQSPVAVAELGR
jgi:hypothetical protein